MEDSTVYLPNSPPVRQYLERMDMFRELVSDLEPEEFERRDPVGFRPCQHFRGASDYATVAKDLTDALAERCRIEPVAKAAVRVCLDEICENVVHHADTSLGGFAAAQGWPKQGRRVFEIAIVDLGVGFRRSLIKNPAYAHIQDDAEAIDTALKPRVTSTPERNAGIGLFITSLVLHFNGGELLVRSGLGAVRRGARFKVEAREVPLPGTVVALRANMDRPLDLTPVYAALEKYDEKRRAQAPSADADDRDHGS
jgi:hypothetical protein